MHCHGSAAHVTGVHAFQEVVLLLPQLVVPLPQLGPQLESRRHSLPPLPQVLLRKDLMSCHAYQLVLPWHAMLLLSACTRAGSLCLTLSSI